jgi:hypothetical protein
MFFLRFEREKTFHFCKHRKKAEGRASGEGKVPDFLRLFAPKSFRAVMLPPRSGRLSGHFSFFCFSLFLRTHSPASCGINDSKLARLIRN